MFSQTNIDTLSSANSFNDSSISFLPGIPLVYIQSSELYLIPCPGASATKTINLASLFQLLFNALSNAHATSSGISPPPEAITSDIWFSI